MFLIMQPSISHLLPSRLGPDIFSRNFSLLSLKSIKTCAVPIASVLLVPRPVLLTILSVAESTQQLCCVSLGRHV
jgi:hypothetical protein